MTEPFDFVRSVGDLWSAASAGGGAFRLTFFDGTLRLVHDEQPRGYVAVELTDDQTTELATRLVAYLAWRGVTGPVGQMRCEYGRLHHTTTPCSGPVDQVVVYRDVNSFERAAEPVCRGHAAEAPLARLLLADIVKAKLRPLWPTVGESSA